MREEFHPRFVVILLIIYQREWLAYFNNHIAITFDLANKAQPINRCLILSHILIDQLTQLIDV
jgi:hypothetical protein